MGAFGSCLGVERPPRAGRNPTLIGSKSVEVDGLPFNHNTNQSRAIMRDSRQSYFASRTNGKSPMPKLLSSLPGQQLLSSHNNDKTHAINNSILDNSQRLVDIDELTSMSPSCQPFTKSLQASNLHMICNGRQPNDGIICGSQENGSASAAVALFNQRLNPNEIKVFIALYDYDLDNSKEDLTFEKGEHLETSPSLMNGPWWLARSKTTKKIGYIPSNYVAELKTIGAEPWFLGKIGRTEAERRLRLPENKDGAFIVRVNDHDDNQFSLSIKHRDHVKHYRIRPHEFGGYFIGKKRVFSTLHDLVLHYSEDMDGLCINLREPCLTRLEKPVPVSLSYDTHDEWEIDKKELTLSHELGRGQFGQVFKGLFRNETPVAIKTLRKESMDPQDFLAEAQIMKKMKHSNLVKLYAVCTKEEPVYIITELMSKGALINYIQTEEGKNLRLSDYINMATQIASGMSYLEREKYVHRDLAARNILVGDNIVCKIADFGLARFIKETEYEARAGAKFPIKWTAPEAANFSKFTIKSDVWSFGIVLYEIVTKGGTPYPDMSNAEVLNRIDKGYRMPQPPGCRDKYYKIMASCWKKDPQSRPTFEALESDLRYYFTSDEQYKEASQFRLR